jgi:hypothetical protein
LEKTKMNEIELAWAAGLFEGEGTVRINKPGVRNWGHVAVSVVNTDRQVVDWFQARWPGYMRPATGLREDQRDAWVWVIAARRAIAFLEQIKPFVVRDAVREKISVAIDFQQQKRNDVRLLSYEDRYSYAEQQWNAYWWMRVLNKRGRQDGARMPPVGENRGSP